MLVTVTSAVVAAPQGRISAATANLTVWLPDAASDDHIPTQVFKWGWTMKSSHCVNAALAVTALVCGETSAQTWHGLGGSAQHTAQTLAPAAALDRIIWSTPIDTNQTLSNGELLAHYGSMMLTYQNTIVLPVKTTRMTSSGLVDSYIVEGHVAKTGALLWSAASDYEMPPHNWLPVYGPLLVPGNLIAYPASGGTVMYRTTPDSATGTIMRNVFYGTMAYAAAQTSYDQNVFINPPISSDTGGNIFFGYEVLGATPIGLQSGVARISSKRVGSWTSVQAATGDASISTAIPYISSSATARRAISLVWIAIRLRQSTRCV